MIPYLDCAAAREQLEAFVDDELAMADQVAVESHLRWCRDCEARVDDLRLMAGAVRVGTPRSSDSPADARALQAIQAEVLTRIRSERDDSLAARLREVCEDMRFFWPALGATAAVVACLLTAVGVLQAAKDEQIDSMAAVVESTANASQIRTGWVLEGVPEEEAVFALAMMVTRQGRIADYQMLLMDRASVRRRDGSALAADIGGLLDAVRQSRFAPSEEHASRAVAVDMVWLTSAPVSDARPARAPRHGRL